MHGTIDVKFDKGRLGKVTERLLVHMVAWRNRPDVARWFWSQPRLTVAKQFEWFTEYEHDERQVRFIIYSEGGKPIGSCGLTDIWPMDGLADVTIYIGEPWARNGGYASAALKALIHYAFLWHQPQLRRLTARVFADNAASLALFEGLGFKREALMREGHIYPEGTTVDVEILGLLKSEMKLEAEQ